MFWSAVGCVCVGLALGLAPAVFGQEAAPGSTAESSTTTYDQDFFAKYDVITVEDIMLRIPGVASILDAVATQASERGFGSGGDQILINGKRMAGKGQIVPTLRRMQVTNIELIDLIRGTSSDIDVQSEGVVINIVLKEGAGTGAGSWQFKTHLNDDGRLNFDGLVNYSDSWGRLDYIVSIGHELLPPRRFVAGDWHTRHRNERYFFPNGSVLEIRDQDFTRQHNKISLTTNLAYNFDNGDRLRVNGLFEPRKVIQDDTTNLTRFNAAGIEAFSATEKHQLHSGWVNRWEVGGDYVRAVGSDGTLDTLFIYSLTDNPVVEFRNQIVGTTTAEISRNLTSQLTTEGIIRSSYSWPLTKKQSVEIGAEAASNTLTQDINVFLDRDRNGQVEEVDIPTAHANVQELRGEVFAIHNWAITGDLSLESSLNTEFSKITNNYPFSPTAKYVFLKPRADLRYELSDAGQIRFKMERTVSQLQFANFVPGFDVVDSEIDAGNPDLRPEKTWTYEVGYQYRLPNRQGLLEGRVFYRDISDSIDKFVIRRETNGERISAIGNIGGARVAGGEVKAGIRLTWLGLPDVGIDARFLRNWSRVTDPFTGRGRNIKGLWDYELDLGFRHDVTDWGLSYGAKYSETSGDDIQSDIRVLRLFRRGPRLEAFAEKTIGAGLTLRVEGFGLMPKHNREFQDRTLYLRDVIDGAVLRTEHYVETRDRRLVVSLRGQF